MYNVAGQNSFMIFVLVTIFFSGLIFVPLASWPRQYFREAADSRKEPPHRRTLKMQLIRARAV